MESWINGILGKNWKTGFLDNWINEFCLPMYNDKLLQSFYNHLSIHDSLSVRQAGIIPNFKWRK